MKSLSHREWKIREHAADELAELGPKAAAAVPALARLLADPHKPVRIAACMALNRIGPAAYPAALRLRGISGSTYGGVVLRY